MSLTPRFSAVPDPSTSGGVSLLYQNEGNWTDHINRHSALLFYESTTRDQASALCASYNESLLDQGIITGQFANDLENQLSYLEYLGSVNSTSMFWINSTGDVGNTSCEALSVASFQTSSIDCSTELPLICSNSANLTGIGTPAQSQYSARVTTPTGLFVTGTRDRFTFRFLGIPFAAQPTGNLRFQYTVPYIGSTEIDATSFKPACLQYGPYDTSTGSTGNPWGNSEDCLYLNIYTPYLPPAVNDTNAPGLKAVMFWIHGGGNTQGTGADPTFDGGSLASRSDVVVVSINYRLNIFGFLALDDGVINGNYALADRIAGLQWVQENIAAFGGDPTRVTVFGESAGGFAVLDLLTSPPASGLFHRAISQSGGDSTFMTQEQAQAAVLPYLEQYCNGTGEERLSCLQSLNASTVLNITNTVTQWDTVSDGYYRNLSVTATMEDAHDTVNKVPFIIGFLPDEGQSLLGTTVAPNATNFTMALTAFGNATAENLVLDSGLWTPNSSFTVYNATVSAYTDYSLTCGGERVARNAAASNALPELYVYRMERTYGQRYYDPYGLCTFPVGDPQPYYRCHASDLYVVFGTYDFFDEPIREPQDVGFGNLIQDFWGSLARTGDPNPSQDYLAARGYNGTAEALESYTWTPYTMSTPELGTLDYPGLGTSELYDAERCEVLGI